MGKLQWEWNDSISQQNHKNKWTLQLYAALFCPELPKSSVAFIKTAWLPKPSSSIFLFTIPHRCSVGFRSDIGTFNSVQKADEQKEAWYTQDGCTDLGPDNTQCTNTSGWTGSPNHWQWKLHTTPQASWNLSISTLSRESGFLFLNDIENVL